MRLFPAPPSQANIRRQTCAARHRRLKFESLEQRALLAANLQITSVVLVDASNNLMTAPVIGQMVFLRAAWRTTDLTTADQYVVTFSVDGVPLNSATITGAPGTNLNWTWYRGGWYASPGLHNVSVTIDGANSVAETTEVDNTLTTTFTPITPTDLPSKFIWPLPSRQSQDWVTVNYNDVNPVATNYSDYRGGPYAYDGHNAFDATLSDFREMDLGEPIYAAASGIVTSTQDGLFDRQTVWNGQDANYIRIDHGSGWQTFYWHLARYTITVAPGDAVQAGQLIGFVGSSGISTASHVHFGATYRGAVVETYFAPDTYFFNPPAYQREAPTRSMGSGVTNYDLNAAGDFGERPSAINVFPNTYSGRVYFHYRVSHLRVGDTWAVTWYRPNGTVESTSSGTYASEVRRGSYYWFLSRPWGNNPGNWQVAYTVNGQELVRENFFIVAPASVTPEITVRQSGAITLDERTTPYDFGSIAQSAAAPQLTWTIENHGYAALSIPAISVPAGFSIVGAAPTSIPVGGSETLTLEMSTATPGYLFGAVELATNDPSESTFSFNVEGTVTGIPAVGSPVVSTSARHTKYHAGNAPAVVDPLATVSDPNTSNWTGGTFNARFASNFSSGDELQIRDQGVGPGQIGVTGVNVTYQGTVIGVQSGSAQALTVALNSAATTAAIQALARNITYRNTLIAPSVAARYLTFTVIDETGLSGWANQTIVPLNDPAIISNVADQVILADTSTAPLAFTLSSADKVRTALSVSAVSSNSSLVSPAGLVLGGSLENRTIQVTPLPGQSGTTTITITVIDVNGGTSTETFSVTVTPSTFRATQVTPTATGAIVHFNRPLSPADLNLIDIDPSLFGAADVTLVQNSTTDVRGSLLISPNRLSITFVSFQGALPDANYTLTLRSAANGFKDSGGNLLDGDSDGTAGGNLVTNFTVASTARQISIPSFARGPGQAADVPSTSTGIPLTISDGAGVTQIIATLFFDVSMLQITGATLPAGLPSGATLNADQSVAGRIILTVNSPTPLSAGASNFVNLIAAVPANAPYTDKHLLDLANLQVNAGAIPVRDLDGVHVVAFMGDATANGAYTSQDASRVSRIGIGLDLGFAGYRMLDPRIVGDLNGNSQITAADTSRTLQLAVGLSVPGVPPLPPGVTVVASGPDPRLWIPTELVARPGELLRIPLQLDSVIDLTGNGVLAVDMALALDPSVFEFVGLERGNLVADGGNWLFANHVDAETGIVHLGIATTGAALEGTFADSLAWLQVRVKENAPLGASSVNLLHHAPSGRQTLVNEGQLLLVPAVSNDPDDPGVDGVVTILPPQRLDVNADGRVSNLDALLVINGLNAGGAAASVSEELHDERRLTAFDALQIINAVDEFHRRAAPAREGTASGGGKADFSSDQEGGAHADHHHTDLSLPFMSPVHANLPGGLEALVHMLALETAQPNHVRVRTVWPLA